MLRKKVRVDFRVMICWSICGDVCVNIKRGLTHKCALSKKQIPHLSICPIVSMAGTHNQAIKSNLCGQVHVDSHKLPYIISFAVPQAFGFLFRTAC